MIKRELKRQCWQRFKTRPANRNHSSLLSSDFHHQNLISLLQSCDRISQTAQLHASMLKTGLDRIPFPLSKLIAQICLQDINYADSIFRRIENPNLYMFNAMLRGHSVADNPRNGLVLFNRMRSGNVGEGFGFDRFTFVSVLKSCSRLEVRAGIGVHAVVVKSGFDLDLNVMNALLHFYCVCERMNDARQVFDEMRLRKDLVSWNSLMGGYLSKKEYSLVLDLFKLLRRESFGFSVTTILIVASAAAQLNASFGESVHLICFKVGFLSNLKVVSALISMYGKQGLMPSARRIFDEVDVKRDVVLWNCLIDGYARSGLLGEALEMVRLMKGNNNLKPNSSTLAGVLSSCSASGALAIGEYVRDYVDEQQLRIDAVLGTAMIDMYAKSGLLEKAIEVFDKLESKDVKTWTAMISGFGTNGQGDNAVKLFNRMEEEGEIAPNEVTFLNVLNACSHGGLVTEGVTTFKRMVEVYELRPKIEHYGCMIDLLGRAGMLEEAYGLIKGLLSERDATAWRALLGACRVYGNVDLAEKVKEELEGMDEYHPADMLSVAGAYAVAGMVRGGGFDLESKRIVKEAGYSKIGL